jgi:hypothetical protein
MNSSWLSAVRQEEINIFILYFVNGLHSKNLGLKVFFIHLSMVQIIIKTTVAANMHGPGVAGASSILNFRVIHSSPFCF